MGILVNSRDGSITPAALLYLIGIPLLSVGYYRSQKQQSPRDTLNFSFTKALLFDGSFELCLSCFFISLACTFISVEFLNDWKIYQKFKGNQKSHELFLLKVRLKKLMPKEILNEIEILISTTNMAKTNTPHQIMCSTVLAYLEELSTQYCQAIKREKLGETGIHEDQLSHDEMDVICQKAVYLVLRNDKKLIHYDRDENYEHDLLLSEALSLLALIAKNPVIRRRHCEMADVFGLDVPINSLRQSLTFANKRAVINKGNELDERENRKEIEKIGAELQRKGCLYLGALADENVDVATLIVNESGLELILDILNWYRFHEELANWGLWAVFILCYENSNNKGILVKLGGITIVCQTMKNNPDSVEVQRHGTAILFDLLRHSCQNENGSSDSIAQVRSLALNAGLHEVVHQAMAKHQKSTEIMMMGREMLVATQFKGEIPNFDGVLAIR